MFNAPPAYKISHPAPHRSGEPVSDCSNRHRESSPEKSAQVELSSRRFYSRLLKKVWRKKPAARSQLPTSTIGSAWGIDCMVGIDTRAHKSVHPDRLLSSNSRSERRGKDLGAQQPTPQSPLLVLGGSVACLGI